MLIIAMLTYILLLYKAELQDIIKLLIIILSILQNKRIITFNYINILCINFN